MKYSILLLIFLLPLTTVAQFWGTTVSGGQSGNGTIFRTDSSVSSVTTIYDFPKIKGAWPTMSKLCEGPQGRLYGMTTYGGTSDYGVLFEFDTLTEKYYELHLFGSAGDGKIPMGSLILADDGKLYGLTTEGGVNNHGTIFSYDPVSRNYEIVFDFDDLLASTGRAPRGTLVEYSPGLFYGTTSDGGTEGNGTIFSYNRVTGTCIPLHNFNVSNQFSGPNGGLCKATNGKLYGTCSGGGLYSKGFLFEFNPAGSSFNVLHQFNGSDGESPNLGVIQATDGLLYGLTSAGGTTSAGVLYSYNPATSTFAVELNLFNNNNGPGQYPYGLPEEGENGNLYCFTGNGGTLSNGTMFVYNYLTSGVFTCLFFDGNSMGKLPLGSLLFSSTGKIYGMSKNGGLENAGVVFSYNPVNTEFDKLVDFGTSPLGWYPAGGLTQVDSNMIFGTTKFGGEYDLGIIFRIDPRDSSVYKVYDFSGVDGSQPQAGMVLAPDGNLYGTVPLGGAYNGGTLFMMDPATGTFQKKWDFSQSSSGKNPMGELTVVNDSILIGTTSQGGLNDDGIIFSYNILSGEFLKLINFSSTTNGAVPWGRLIREFSGKYYGMTTEGGSAGKGLIFKFDYENLILDTLRSFVNDSLGYFPFAGLSQYPDGMLYGLTTEGGVYNDGVVFSLDPQTNIFEQKHDMCAMYVGEKVKSELLVATDGRMPGLASFGGNMGMGTIFNFDQQTDTVISLFNFGNPAGEHPMYGKLVEECHEQYTAILPFPDTLCEGDFLFLSGTGSHLYAWDNGVVNGRRFKPAAGNHTYTLTGYDVCGNEASAVAVVYIHKVDTSATISGSELEAQAQDAVFQWIDCSTGDPIPGAVDSLFYPSDTGYYAVIVTQLNCTDTSRCLHYATFNVDENRFSRTTVYPNPVDNYLNIKNMPVGLKSITIYGISGSIIQEYRTDEQESQLDISVLEPGFYSLVVKQGEDKTQYKLIVQ